MSDAHRESCRMHKLAESPIGEVALCPECGVFHLTLHYMTLRFEPAAFEQLVWTLSQARAALLRQNQQHEAAGTAPAEATESIKSIH